MLLAVFFMLMGWSVYQGMTGKGDPIVGDVDAAAEEPMPLGRAIFWLVFGLVLLVASSRLLVWGAVSIAEGLGVSDLALGNVLGSNLFNTLAVVGIAGAITPVPAEPAVFYRDWVVMTVLTMALFLMGYGFRGVGTGRINRIEGGILLAPRYSRTLFWRCWCWSRWASSCCSSRSTRPFSGPARWR